MRRSKNAKVEVTVGLCEASLEAVGGKLSDSLENKFEQEPIDRVLDHLRQALMILDAGDFSAEFGARLDHLICSLDMLRQSTQEPSRSEKPWAH